MRLTSKGRYLRDRNVKTLRSTPKRAGTVADISERQGISLSYAGNYFSVYVKRSGFQRTPGRAAVICWVDAGSIAVGEVISAVDESVDATRCEGRRLSGRRCRLTHALWRDLSDRLTGFSTILQQASW